MKGSTHHCLYCNMLCLDCGAFQALLGCRRFLISHSVMRNDFLFFIFQPHFHPPFLPCRLIQSCTWYLSSSMGGIFSSTCTGRACLTRAWLASTLQRLSWPLDTFTALALCIEVQLGCWLIERLKKGLVSLRFAGCWLTRALCQKR